MIQHPVSLPTATAAPRIARAGSREYRVAPMTLGSLGELVTYVQDRYESIFARNVKSIPEGYRTSIIAYAASNASRIAPGSPEFEAISLAPDGVARVAWLHLRTWQPELTPDGVAELLEDPSAGAEIFAAIERAERGDQGATPGGKQSAPSPNDSGLIMRALADRYGIGPREACEMTPAQITMYLSGSEGGNGSGIDRRTGRRTVRVNSMEEAQALIGSAKGGSNA
jgi:hypothetical protein